MIMGGYMDNIIIFGAGNTGIRAYERYCKDCNVLCFLDNDEEKWGTELRGITILEPTYANIKCYNYDYILIASVYGKQVIEKQLNEMGIPKDKVRILQSNPDVLSPFLKCLSELFDSKNVEGSIAEVGVFQGDSAEKMNRFFGNRTLHLFDTFNGFSDKDTATEIANNYSTAKANQYDDTSIELVMSKMSNPLKVVIHKGYFPDTATGIDESFSFVRIDLDLHKPTVAALNFFHPLMVNGGCILVHDYFGESYKGVKEAITEYIIKHPELRLLPIGDSLSVAIVGY